MDVFKARGCVAEPETPPAAVEFQRWFEKNICGVITSHVNLDGGLAVVCFAIEAARRVHLQIPHTLAPDATTMLDLTIAACPGNQPIAVVSWDPTDDIALTTDDFQAALTNHFATVAKPSSVLLNVDDRHHQHIVPSEEVLDCDTETEPVLDDSIIDEDDLTEHPQRVEVTNPEAAALASLDCVNEPPKPANDQDGDGPGLLETTTETLKKKETQEAEDFDEEQQNKPTHVRRSSYILSFTRSDVRDAIARLGPLDWESSEKKKVSLTMRRDGKSLTSAVKRKNKPGARTGVGGDDAHKQVWIGGIATLTGRERVIEFFDKELTAVLGVDVIDGMIRVTFANADGCRCVGHNPRHFVVVPGPDASPRVVTLDVVGPPLNKDDEVSAPSELVMRWDASPPMALTDLVPHLDVVKDYVAGYTKTSRWHTGSPKKNAQVKLEYGFLTFNSAVVRDGVYALQEVAIDGTTVMIKAVKAKGSAALRPSSNLQQQHPPHGMSPLNPVSQRGGFVSPNSYHNRHLSASAVNSSFFDPHHGASTPPRGYPASPIRTPQWMPQHQMPFVPDERQSPGESPNHQPMYPGPPPPPPPGPPPPPPPQSSSSPGSYPNRNFVPQPIHWQQSPTPHGMNHVYSPMTYWDEQQNYGWQAPVAAPHPQYAVPTPHQYSYGPPGSLPQPHQGWVYPHYYGAAPLPATGPGTPLNSGFPPLPSSRNRSHRRRGELQRWSPSSTAASASTTTSPHNYDDKESTDPLVERHSESSRVSSVESSESIPVSTTSDDTTVSAATTAVPTPYYQYDSSVKGVVMCQDVKNAPVKPGSSMNYAAVVAVAANSQSKIPCAASS